MYPVSRIVNLIFVAVFEGPIMLLTTVKFIFMQYQYIHCSTSLYVHTHFLKKYNFCHIQIYLSLAGKGLKYKINSLHTFCVLPKGSLVSHPAPELCNCILKRPIQR